MKRYLVAIFAMMVVVQSMLGQAQQFTMEGVVSDNSGPLPGVTITISDKATTGVVSDIDGKFSIKAVRGDKLVFSYVGMKKIEYLVTEEKRDLKIKFVEEESKLDEVVVTALGTQR